MLRKPDTDVSRLLTDEEVLLLHRRFLQIIQVAFKCVNVLQSPTLIMTCGSTFCKWTTDRFSRAATRRAFLTLTSTNPAL